MDHEQAERYAVERRAEEIAIRLNRLDHAIRNLEAAETQLKDIAEPDIIVLLGTVSHAVAQAKAVHKHLTASRRKALSALDDPSFPIPR